MDATLNLLTWVALVTGLLAGLGSLWMARTQPAQRKGHIARSVLFLAIAAFSASSIAGG